MSTKHETTQKHLKLPSEVVFPDDLKNKICYDSSKKILIFKGVMCEHEKDVLLKLSSDELYKKAIEKLFKKSKNGKIFVQRANTIYQYFSTVILLSAAGALIGYEMFIFGIDVIDALKDEDGIKGIEHKNIFHALILSTTSVAFVGMHYVINILIRKDTDPDEPLDKKDFAMFFSLMANALLLAGLIVAYKKFFIGE